MGLFGAMTASVSGLGANGQAISVISDNLANTNTIGYKASRSLFSQLVTTSGSGGTAYNSGGVKTNVARDQTSQGSFITNTSKTDLAITGNGFFKVSDSKVSGSSTSSYYTRAGSFSENKEGYLVNPDGLYLQGWKTDTDGTITDIQNPQAIELQSVGVSAQKSSELSIDANLNNTETINAIYATTGSLSASLAAVLADPTKADYVTDVRVYDAQGGARDMTVAFTKRAANLWDWQLYTDGANIQGGTSGTNVQVGSGILQFTTTGSLQYATGTSITANWANGVDSSTITLNFGDYVGGNEMTANTGLGFTDDVLGITAENTDTLTPGTYTLRATGVGTFELGTGTGAGFVAIPGEPAVTIGANGTREIYFANSNVRITVSNDFNEDPGAGTYPAGPPAGLDVGTFTLTAVGRLNKGLGTDGVTQLSANYDTSSVNQNGFGAGTLSAISVDGEGFVIGTFTNGETKKLYKIALAVFQNPDALETVSGSLLRTTDASGNALLKEAGIGGTGQIASGNLEGSTTDIAGEFSNMIVAQRAFQASSKVITTVDQMLNELLQLR
jgi:flagellar hook protein FlgE